MTKNKSVRSLWCHCGLHPGKSFLWTYHFIIILWGVRTQGLYHGSSKWHRESDCSRLCLYFPLSVWTRPSAEKPFVIMRLYHPGLFPGPGTIISLCAHFYNTKGRHGFSALAAPPVSACFLLALLNAITDQFTFKVIGEHKGVWGSKFLNEISYSCMSLYALRKAPLFSGACFLEV